MNINGTEIKIGRPKSYENTMSQIGLNPGAGLSSLSKNAQDGLQKENQGLGNSRLKWGGRLSDELYSVTLPSRVLQIRNINTFNISKDFHDYRDLYSDIYDLCTQLGGPVDQIKIPRPIFVESRVEETKAEDQLKTKLEAEAEEKQAANDPKFIKKSERRKARQKRDEDAGRTFKDEICPTDDSRNHDFPPGFGSAFVLFSYTTDCVRARKSINLMKYNRTQAVECIFFQETKFHSEDFEVLRKIPEIIPEVPSEGEN